MQNKYIGDKGDFGKYLLLKKLCGDKLHLGVNWCLVPDDFDNQDNNDGKFTSYLHENAESSIYSNVDSELFKKLQELLKSGKRCISFVERFNILPSNTYFFSELISSGTYRYIWHDKSLKQLESCDVIFYDPDNGLEVKSCGKLSSNAVKYVFYDEIRDTFRAGKSIIIYQHTNRGKNVVKQIESRVKELVNCLLIPVKSISVVYSGLGTSRYFMIIKQSKSKHIDNINRAILEIEEDNRFRGILKVVRNITYDEKTNRVTVEF